MTLCKFAVLGPLCWVAPLAAQQPLAGTADSASCPYAQAEQQTRASSLSPPAASAESTLIGAGPQTAALLP